MAVHSGVELWVSDVKLMEAYCEQFWTYSDIWLDSTGFIRSQKTSFLCIIVLNFHVEQEELYTAQKNKKNKQKWVKC